jgi:hypothetical protein
MQTISGSGALAADSNENLESMFATLAEQWRQETAMFSSISKKVKHPAYQKIIAMGDDAVPLILREMRARPAHWFNALKSITGTSPAGEREGFNVDQATAAWLKWGKQRGLLD